MGSLKLSVVASALTDELRDAPRLAREAGFAGLQFDALSLRLRIPDLAQSGRRELLHLIADQDRQLIGLRADLGSKGFGPGADVDRLLSQLDKTLEAAAGLAAPLLCLDLGPLPEPQKFTKPKPAIAPGLAGLLILPESTTTGAEPVPTGPAPDPKFVSVVDAAMADLGSRADRYNVMVAVRSELSSFAAVDAVLARARCPWFGIDLDPSLALYDEWPLDEILSRLGNSVHHVRGRDATVGSERRTKPATLGRGDVAWRQLLTDLHETDYQGWLTVDPIDLPDRRGGAIAAGEYLAALLAQ